MYWVGRENVVSSLGRRTPQIAVIEHLKTTEDTRLQKFTHLSPGEFRTMVYQHSDLVPIYEGHG